MLDVEHVPLKESNAPFGKPAMYSLLVTHFASLKNFLMTYWYTVIFIVIGLIVLMVRYFRIM